MASAGEGVALPSEPDVDVGSGNWPEPDRPDPSAGRRRARRAQATIVVALGCGGLLGAVSRYALSLAVPTETGRFPWGTFLVNVSGSAVLGFVLVLLVEQFPRGRLARPVIGTGFIGAYTTFSTFMVEAVLLIRDGRAGDAIAYLAGSVITGLLAVWLGMAGARLVLRAERRLQEELG